MELNLCSGTGRIESGAIGIGSWNTVSVFRKFVDGLLIVNEKIYKGKSGGLFRGFDYGETAFIGSTERGSDEIGLLRVYFQT